MIKTLVEGKPELEKAKPLGVFPERLTIEAVRAHGLFALTGRGMIVTDARGSGCNAIASALCSSGAASSFAFLFALRRSTVNILSSQMVVVPHHLISPKDNKYWP